jgi:hypothetical protein
MARKMRGGAGGDGTPHDDSKTVWEDGSEFNRWRTRKQGGLQHISVSTISSVVKIGLAAIRHHEAKGDLDAVRAIENLMRSAGYSARPAP